MSKELKFSLISAAFNEGENLKNFFNFWLHQNYNDFEIVIVNDGSTDNTSEIIKEYVNKYPDKIKLIELDRNKGVGNARLQGFINSIGDVIKFQDTDFAPDLPIDKNLISRFVEPFKDNEVDCVFFSFSPFIDKDNLIRTLENIYHYYINSDIPEGFETIKSASGNFPSIFRKKNLDLSGVLNIRNGEDRFIADRFLKNSRKNGAVDGAVVMDVYNVDLKETIRRYINYGFRSDNIYQIDKKLFLMHLAKPFIIAISIFALVFSKFNLIFFIPFFFIYFFFFILTFNASRKYIKKNYELMFELIFVGPLYLYLRYLCLFLGILKLFLRKYVIAICR